MVDQFPHVAVGDAIYELLVMPFKTDTKVTKGQVVKLTHVAADFPTIKPSDASTYNIGVAMETIEKGAVGKVLVVGVIKVTADATDGIYAGSSIGPGAAGTVKSTAMGDLIGRGLQDIAAGETGLVMINCLS